MTTYTPEKVSMWRQVAEMVGDRGALDQIEYIETLQRQVAMKWREISELATDTRLVLLLNENTRQQITGRMDRIRSDGSIAFIVYHAGGTEHIQDGFTHFMDLPTAMPKDQI